ncbi:hypothetical protein CCACVL1_06419, partial [Corchorus capsularis]
AKAKEEYLRADTLRQEALDALRVLQDHVGEDNLIPEVEALVRDLKKKFNHVELRKGNAGAKQIKEREKAVVPQSQWGQQDHGLNTSSFLLP